MDKTTIAYELLRKAQEYNMGQPINLPMEGEPEDSVSETASNYCLYFTVGNSEALHVVSIQK